MHFEFATANRIIFGPGCLNKVGPLAAELGQRVLVVTGSRVEPADKLLDLLTKLDLACKCFSVSGEPSVETLMQGLDTAGRHKCDLVLGIGGGSVIDTGKAIAALLNNTGDVMEYLEVIGNGQPLKQPPVAYIAIPTTAGTGAEVTRNAVLKSTRHAVKVSLRSPLMLPNIALVDPELTLSMPPSVTAATGMDALTQLLEAMVSKKSNPLTDGICREGLHRAAGSLKKAYLEPDNLKARSDMSLASLFSGLALANAGLGAVHGIAGPLGGMCAAPHGSACARLLPVVTAANVTALQNRQPGSAGLKRYRAAARLLTGNGSATVNDGIEWLYRLCTGLRIPTLSECGFREDQISQLVHQAQQASSMKGNPVELTAEELEEIIRSAF